VDIKIRITVYKLFMTQCAKILVGLIANFGNVFYQTFTDVFFKKFSIRKGMEIESHSNCSPALYPQNTKKGQLN